MDSDWIRLAGSNGIPIPIVGIFKTCVHIQGQSFNDIYVLVVFDPIDDSVRKRKEAVPGVIGGNIFDLLYRKSSTQDLPLALSSSLKKYQEQLVLCERITAEIQKRDSDVLGAVKTIKGLVTLPANTETSITCTTCKNIEDYTVLIEPADDATLLKV